MNAGARAAAGARGRLVETCAALAAGDPEALDRELAATARAVEEGVLEARAVEEALLQSHLFLGFPAVLRALSRWRGHRPGPPEEADPLAGPEAAGARRERGEEVCRRVYGRAYGALRRNVAGLHPALDRWMVDGGYGKVLGRPGLDLGVRELCIVALLAVRGWRPQLHSHLRGALNVGVEPAVVAGALETALERVPGKARREETRELWRRVRRRARRQSDDAESSTDSS